MASPRCVWTPEVSSLRTGTRAPPHPTPRMTLKARLRSQGRGAGPNEALERTWGPAPISNSRLLPSSRVGGAGRESPAHPWSGSWAARDPGQPQCAGRRSSECPALAARKLCPWGGCPRREMWSRGGEWAGICGAGSGSHCRGPSPRMLAPGVPHPQARTCFCSCPQTYRHSHRHGTRGSILTRHTHKAMQKSMHLH